MYYQYSEAVNQAANRVLNDRAAKRAQRIERLFELLYSLAETIPVSWATASRGVLARREHSIELIVKSLSSDVAEHTKSSEYFVLSSVLLLALTIKQLNGSEQPFERGEEKYLTFVS